MDHFLLKSFLFLSIYALLIFLFNAGMRKILNVKRKKRFSYNHVNAHHKKLDWMIRFTFLILIVIGGIYNASNLDQEGRVWYLEPHMLIFGFVLVSETVRAFFEKRHSANPNDYKFTLSQLAFLSITLLLFFTTEFFGIFT
ncbi:DUF4181 domain-containing protein [Rossellomorea vietnamensis]|uniref:DUF4181 domain-containing protein n=1 Tax=Rossellomorea vietnamensis TaxID=218284 RepID=A0A0P6WI70_9BACI|nr:DUF4181 domain-containing protein [Rossellomorea vietnamensis]KPL60297.1 hypothetical protein AM506_06705 [Rossellomorea vietnamensis]